jgi:flagellar biosynthesis protein FlhG
LASGKGGTGKTFLSIGLAAALADEGERVLLWDADLGLSNTIVQLGLASGGDFAGVLAGRTALCQGVVAVRGGARSPGGFDLLASGAGCGLVSGLAPEPLLRLGAELRLAGMYDRVLVDLGPGIDNRTLQIAAWADETLLVMTPDPASLTDAYAFAKLMVRQGAGLPTAIVNMAAGTGEAQRVFGALAATVRAFLQRNIRSAGFVPRDPHVANAIRRQTSPRAAFPQSPASSAINAIARRLHRAMTPERALVAVR